jgi:hypothetical protein
MGRATQDCLLRGLPGEPGVGRDTAASVAVGGISGACSKCFLGMRLGYAAVGSAHATGNADVDDPETLD